MRPNLGDQEGSAEHQTIFDPHTCTRRGMCPVTQIRHQHEPLESHSLYFEVHGSGPQKVIFIMGLNDNSFAWLPQVDHFGKLEKYSTLVFDNRGVGMSGSPLGPYSTSGMAEDILCLLNYLQWTENRSLHIVGISLGGMIAQACIPHPRANLVPQPDRNTSWWKSLGQYTLIPRMRDIHEHSHFVLPSSNSPARLLTMSDPDKKIPIIMDMLFPEVWLDYLAENDPQGRTNREVESDTLRRRSEITKPQTIMGALGQMAAVLTHRMTSERLSKVSASVPKVLILSAAQDLLIPYTEGETLKRYMPEAEYQCWENTGHGVCGQSKQRFNKLMETVFEQGSEAAGRRVESD